MTAHQHGDRRPTILEVARLAEVSHQTVSRYLRFGGDGLKPKTRDSVARAIAELNYRPNLVARSMRTRVTGRVAVVMPPLAYSPTRMLSGATSRAHAAGYQVDVISPEGGPSARADRIRELASMRQVDGILSFSPVALTAEDVAADTVLVVSADLDEAMRTVGELAEASPIRDFITALAELGHRRFMHVAGSAEFASARARQAMYLEAIEDLGLTSVGVHAGDWSGQSGVDAVESIRSGAEPTAIIAANDLVATGVLRAARMRGWDVPGDVSVTGWDNVAHAEFLWPALTTVDVNLDRVGGNAMGRLIAQLRDEPPELDLRPVNSVIWRESTGPAPSTS